MGNKPKAPLFNKGYASVSSFGNGAKARAVTTSMDSGALSTKSSTRMRMDDGRRAGSLHGLAQKRRLFAYAFDQVDVCAVRIGERAGDHDTRKTGA